MNQNINFTKHACKRAQQRGINKIAFEHLLTVGNETHCGGGSIRYSFTPSSRKRLKKQLTPTEYAQIETKLNIYAVISNTGYVITVGHQYKSLRRH